MRLYRIIGLCALTSILAACGSENSGVGKGNVALDTVRAVMTERKAAKAAKSGGSVAKQKRTLQRSDLAKIKQPILRFSIPRNGFSSIMTKVSQNGANATYFNKGGQSITLRHGRLIATRGFVGDLYGVDDRSKLSPGYRYLTLENHIAEIKLRCRLESQASETIEIVQISYNLIRREEICKSKTRAFKNRYWQERNSGKIWKSEQWIGPILGHGIIEILQ